MKAANPPCGHTTSLRIVTSNTRRYKANNTHYTNSCKPNFTGHGVYSCHPHDSIKIKIKNVIVKFGSYAPDLAYFLLNIFRLRGA